MRKMGLLALAMLGTLGMVGGCAPWHSLYRDDGYMNITLPPVVVNVKTEATVSSPADSLPANPQGPAPRCGVQRAEAAAVRAEAAAAKAQAAKAQVKAEAVTTFDLTVERKLGGTWKGRGQRWVYKNTQTGEEVEVIIEPPYPYPYGYPYYGPRYYTVPPRQLDYRYY